MPLRENPCTEYRWKTTKGTTSGVTSLRAKAIVAP